MVKRYTITPIEAAEIYTAAGLGQVSPETIKNWVRNEVIHGTKVGGKWHIDKKKFLKFLQENKP
jgi:hypothetical protein